MTRSQTTVEVSSDRGVFMISVAAELAEMHPQTLRMYEARGLIEPKRSPKGTRLYSQQDVERLRRIQAMTAELGMNLAGVERVFELEQELESMARKVQSLEKRARELKAEVAATGGAAPGAPGRDRPVRRRRGDRPPRRRAAVPDPGPATGPLSAARGSAAERRTLGRAATVARRRLVPQPLRHARRQPLRPPARRRR